jgi:hypothetical protein
MTYHTTANLLAAGFTVPDLPPSLRAAAANVRLVPIYEGTVRDSTMFDTAYSNDASDQAAASAPLSFHNRSLQLALPRMQYDMDEFPEEAFLPDLSFSARADSAIGGYDEIPNFGDFENPQLDMMRYDESLRGQGRADTHSIELPRVDPLQYHLIQTQSRVSFQDSVTTSAPPHDQPEVAPRSSARYVPTSALGEFEILTVV